MKIKSLYIIIAAVAVIGYILYRQNNKTKTTSTAGAAETVMGDVVVTTDRKATDMIPVTPTIIPTGVLKVDPVLKPKSISTTVLKTI